MNKKFLNAIFSAVVLHACGAGGGGNGGGAVAPSTEIPITQIQGKIESGPGAKPITAEAVQVALVWQSWPLGTRKEVQKIEIEPKFPASFSIDISHLPPKDGLLGIDEFGCMKYLTGRVIAFVDKNKNGKLDFIPRTATEEVDLIIARSKQTVTYMELSKSKKCQDLLKIMSPEELKRMFPFGFTDGSFIKDENGDFVQIKDASFNLYIDEEVSQEEMCEPRTQAEVDKFRQELYSPEQKLKGYKSLQSGGLSGIGCQENGKQVYYLNCSEVNAYPICKEPICFTSMMELSNNGSQTDACDLYRQKPEAWPCEVPAHTCSR